MTDPRDIYDQMANPDEKGMPYNEFQVRRCLSQIGYDDPGPVQTAMLWDYIARHARLEAARIREEEIE